MKLLHATTLAIVLSGAPLLLRAAEPATGPITFRVSVLVDVDASGKPVKVEASKDIPQAIRNFIEKRVASWQYQPARIGGVPQPATTYVNVNACAVPTTGGYTMGVDFDDNGPRTLSGKELVPPNYPITARNAGTEAEFSLILDIGADGHAELSSIENVDFNGRVGSSEFAPALRRWARGLRFDVERLAGKPVSSKMRMEVEFVLRGSGHHKRLVDESLAKASASRECQIAAGNNGMKPVALDSVLKVTPIPAG